MKIVSTHDTAIAIERMEILAERCSTLLVDVTNERDEQAAENVYDQCEESIEYFTREPHTVDPDWKIRIEKWEDDIAKIERKVKRKKR